MALTDPTKSKVTQYNSEDQYIAGDEPWNVSLDNYSIPPESTEAVTYICDFSRWHGIYRKIPEIRSTIDTETRWIIGKKLSFGDKKTSDFAKKVRGKGKDTLRKILLNILKTGKMCGDCYVWAPRDSAGRLLNLKVLDSGTIEVQADKFGVIQKYVQIQTKGEGSKIPSSGRVVLDEWEPKEIFHYMHEPIADQIHGIPDTEKLLEIIKMRHQGMSDISLIYHTYGKPTFLFEANTDDETELEDIRTKLESTKKNFQDAVFPKGTLEKIERVATPQYSNLDPLPWINFLRSYFTESSGVPELVRGKSDEVSLAAGKLNFVSFKEMVQYKQLEFSEDLESQLGLKITFETPIEIDLEISRTEEAMDKKRSAKEEKGGELQLNTKRTSEKL